MDTLNLKDESFKENIIFVDDRPGHDYRYSLDSSLQKRSGLALNANFLRIKKQSFGI